MKGFSSEVFRKIRELTAEPEMQHGKSPGGDGIPAELLKEAGERGAKIIYKLCNILWRTLAKKWRPEKLQNYRSISLLCYASKILLIIIHKRTKQQLERNAR